MTAPTFARAAGSSDLYWLAEATLPAGAGVALVTDVAAPASFDLAASWTSYPGIYAIVGVRPAAAGEAAFVTALRTWCAWLGTGTRFVWIEDATADPDGWTPSAMQIAQTANTGVSLAPARLGFGAYQAILARGLAIALTPDASGFALSGAAPCAWLSTPTDQWVMTLPTDGVALPFAGAAAGCVRLDLALPQDVHATGIDDYDRLDVGMRYGFDRPPLDGAADPTGGGLLESQRYPVFVRVPSGGVALSGQLDPSRPLDTARTRLVYAAGAAHASHYRGPLGAGVTLAPAAGSAGLGFHRRPGSRHDLASDDPHYLAPIGSFTASCDDGSAALGCGLSGYESFAWSSPSAGAIAFVASQPACAARIDAAAPRAVGDAALTSRATCSYAIVSAAGGATVTYYAQPERSALHTVRSASSPPLLVPYLEFVAVPAASAPSANPYPLVPYAGIPAGDLDDAAALERAVLSPLRRNAIASVNLCARASEIARADPPPDVVATTPRGLLATLDGTLATWRSLQMISADPGATPSIELLSLGSDLRGALLSNQIFCVIGDPAAFARESDFNYWITDAALRDLTALPAAQRPPAAILDALSARGRAPQPGQQAFITYLGTLGLPSGWQAYQAVIVQYAAYFEVDIEGWRFRLSPLLWSVNADPDHPVLMVAKFASSTFRALVADPSAWTWSQAAIIGGDPDKARAVLQAIIDTADAQVAAAGDANPSPLAYFVDQIVDDASWCGVLFFNAPVPLDDLPDELRGLAAGIDASKFRAHHVGVTLGPVTVDVATRTLGLGTTPLFGLIDYEDPVDLAQAPGDSDFNFKVLQLRIRFASSKIVDFASRIELYVAALFGAPVVLLDSDHGNNLVLDGSYQRTASGGHYVFMRRQASRYQSQSQVLGSIEVTLAQFNTLAGSSPTSATVSSRFAWWGRLRFALLDGLDAFSFGPEADTPSGPGADGYLAFSGLAVDMTFEADDPQGTRSLALDIAGVQFDATQSVSRADSLFRRFPLVLAGMSSAPKGTRPSDRGFLPVRSALYQPALDDGWFAIVFTIDLGTLGALAADVGLVVTLLAAWAPGIDRPAVNLGLALPGVQSLGQLLPIEGVLQLGFRSLSLDGSPAASGGTAYALRMQRFYLRLLGWQFPPGQADLYLFGDPELASQPAGGRRSGVGWYAVYKKKE